MKRLLSDAVKVRSAPSEAVRVAAILDGHGATAYTPTEAEVRDAMQRLAASMQEMVAARIAGAAGWEVGDLQVALNTTAEGEVTLRGFLLLTRDEEPSD